METNGPRGKMSISSYVNRIFPDREGWLSGCLFQDFKGSLCPHLMAGPAGHTVSKNSKRLTEADSSRVVPLLPNLFSNEIITK